MDRTQAADDRVDKTPNGKWKRRRSPKYRNLVKRGCMICCQRRARQPGRSGHAGR